MDKLDTKAILESVRANLARLDSCDTPHDFQIIDDPRRKLFARWKCTKCGGDVDPLHRHWYERGLKDAENRRSG